MYRLQASSETQLQKMKVHIVILLNVRMQGIPSEINNILFVVGYHQSGLEEILDLKFAGA